MGTPFTATHSKGAANAQPACLTQQAANSPGGKELDIWADIMISGKFKDRFLSFDRECHVFLQIESLSVAEVVVRNVSMLRKKRFLGVYSLFGFVGFFSRCLRVLLAAQAVPDLHRLFRLDSGHDFWN